MAIEAGEQDNLVAPTNNAATDGEDHAVGVEQSRSQVLVSEPEQADSADAFEEGITREPFDEDGQMLKRPTRQYLEFRAT